MLSRVLFIMPVLGTPEYTKMAYESFINNTRLDRHKVIVTMDLDREEDKRLYEQWGIPYVVRQSYGAWIMLVDAMLTSLANQEPYQFIGLIHNDMVFGEDWLGGFENFTAKFPDDYRFHHHIFSNRQLGASNSPGALVRTMQNFDFKEFERRASMIYQQCDMDEGIEVGRLEFQPWIWSFDAIRTTFRYFWGQDPWIINAFAADPRIFEAVCFMNCSTYHFGTVATTILGEWQNRLQHQPYFWPFKASNHHYLDLASFLVSCTPWQADQGIYEIFKLAEQNFPGEYTKWLAKR